MAAAPRNISPSLLLSLIVLTVALLEVSADKPPFKIVQVGDSYSAGAGSRDENGELNYVAPISCYRSPTNWGEPFANTLNDTYEVTYINAACFGATVPDVWRDDGSRPTQLDSIDETVDLVLVNMGANDVGWGGVVAYCFFFRDAEDCQGRISSGRSQFDNVKSQLVDAFVSINATMKPGGRILFVGYPHLVLKDSGFSLQTEAGTSFLAAEAVRNVTSDFQQEVLMEAVTIANDECDRDCVEFIDIQDLFDGHEADPEPFDFNPDRWIWEFEGPDINEWMHLNPTGYQQITGAVAQYWGLGDEGPGDDDEGSDACTFADNGCKNFLVFPGVKMTKPRRVGQICTERCVPLLLVWTYRLRGFECGIQC